MYTAMSSDVRACTPGTANAHSLQSPYKYNNYVTYFTVYYTVIEYYTY